MTNDRADAEDFRLTHDVLAAMLGVRRPSVSIAAGRLRRAALIHYRRGRMRVPDRERLRAAACDDYRRPREIYDRCFSSMDGAGSPE